MTAPSWKPSASWDTLRQRAELLRRLRHFFARHGFLEVDTPLLSADTVVDRHIDPVAVALPDDLRRPQSGLACWLQTSPEFHMKRLLAAGGEAMYQVTRSFRLGESGPLHNPEFAIVEWYRLGDSLDAEMEFTGLLAQTLLQRPAAVRLSYADAFARHVGVDPHRASAAELRSRATALGVPSPQSLADDDRDGWLDLLLVEKVESQLTGPAPILLYDYPASQAALATTHGDPPRARRFEMHVDGVELANGYHELLDADTLRARIVEQNRLRVLDGKPALPAENRLLDAMEFGLPSCTGVAMGFDRLVMLALGKSSLAEVTAFPIDRA